MTYSVIIPVYNHAKYIESTIQSVQQQTLPPCEIIVIDDGSTDASAEIASKLAKKDPRIAFWSQPNRGAHNTINAGLQRSTTDTLAILNSDDLFKPKRMERCIEALNAYPSVDAVATRLTCINGDGEPITNTWYENALREAEAFQDLAIALLNANHLMTTSNLVIRRSALDRSGLFLPLRYAHDLEFFTRLLRLGGHLMFIDSPLMQYRIHSSNTINENHQKVRAEWAFVIAWHMHQLVLASSNGVANGAIPKDIFRILNKHNLAALVQWMSWFCERSHRDGFLPFDHPDWTKAFEAALDIDR